MAPNRAQAIREIEELRQRVIQRTTPIDDDECVVLEKDEAGSSAHSSLNRLEITKIDQKTDEFFSSDLPATPEQEDGINELETLADALMQDVTPELLAQAVGSAEPRFVNLLGRIHEHREGVFQYFHDRAYNPKMIER